MAQNRDKAYERRMNNLRAEFGVVEHNGSLYLMHNDVAIAKVNAQTSAEEIAALLNVVRDTAVEFERS